MQISILCVGKVRESFFSEAMKEYKKRLGRYAKIQVFEVADEKTPEHASDAMEEIIRAKEGERLKKYLKESMYTIALDLAGTSCDSIEFSKKLSGKMLAGESHIAFIIGGSLGLHSSILKMVDERVSFSKMTFPHPLMRVILLEQIYRAMRIMNGEPYHK